MINRIRLTVLVLLMSTFSLVWSYNWDYFPDAGYFNTLTGWDCSNAVLASSTPIWGGGNYLHFNSSGYAKLSGLSISQDVNSLHILAYRVRNNSSSSSVIITANVISGGVTYQSIDTIFQSEMSQKYNYLSIRGTITNIEIYTSAGNVDIDNLLLISNPVNGSFEKDNSEDGNSRPFDSLPGYWKRSAVIWHMEDSADPFTAGINWGMLNKSRISNPSVDGDMVGVISVPAKTAAFDKKYREVYFWRELMTPANAARLNTVYVNAQAKVWGDTNTYGTYTATLKVHKLGSSYSCSSSYIQVSNTPTIIQLPNSVTFNTNDYCWIEIGIENPPYNSKNMGAVLYIDEVKAFAHTSQ